MVNKDGGKNSWYWEKTLRMPKMDTHESRDIAVINPLFPYVSLAIFMDSLANLEAVTCL